MTSILTLNTPKRKGAVCHEVQVGRHFLFRFTAEMERHSWLGTLAAAMFGTAGFGTVVSSANVTVFLICSPCKCLGNQQDPRPRAKLVISRLFDIQRKRRECHYPAIQYGQMGNSGHHGNCFGPTSSSPKSNGIVASIAGLIKYARMKHHHLTQSCLDLLSRVIACYANLGTRPLAQEEHTG